MILFPDALLAGDALRAGLEGSAAAPGLGAAGLLVLLAPLLLAVASHLRALLLAAEEEGPPGGETAAPPPIAGAGPGRLRLVAGVCAAIGALFALVGVEALGVLPLQAMAGLFVGAVAFLAFALRCWNSARAR